ncbi:MAG: adenylate/guanylate cyclase domain-containing protein, partial [Treponema sp.]|nr:adenylate/guanylate cyclase domain-containing protein [Treponema sp.]
LMSGKPAGGIYELYNGDWAYAQIMIYNSKGEAAGMFEVGFDMTGYELNNAKLKRNVTFTVAVICLIILFVLAVTISVIIRQLSSVARVLKAISDGKRHERVRYKARDELGRVSHGLNNMAEELQIQFDRITRLNESTIRFVPVQFMEHLGVSDISKMKLGDNVLRDLSVLFFDIRAFSINSEMMTSHENFIFINEILGIAGPIIRKNEGFVDKFIGDAAMALFVNGIDAVRAGIELYQKLVIDKTTRVKIGVDGINIGVGIHTGSVMMGIVGENERLSSTVISANVNLASRLEGLSKQTGSGVLISKDTMNQLTGRESEFSYRFIGMVRAAGVNEVLGLFDIIDALPQKDRKLRLLTKKVFESGVRKFHTKDYAAAVHRFEKVIEADPGDICAIHHLEEAKKHLADPSLQSVFSFDKK